MSTHNVQKATNLSNTSALWWAAGFLEGEASFAKTIAVYQVNREPLDRLQQIFGGSIRPRPSRDNSQPHFIWITSGARARGIMMTLYPFLTEKRQQSIKQVLDI